MKLNENQLTSFFKTQKLFRDRITYKEEDRFGKLGLALLVEIGECANEWRGFKFWSQDQEPRVRVPIYKIGKSLDHIIGYENKVLGEFVDILAFTLDLGIEIAEEIRFDPDQYIDDIMVQIKHQTVNSGRITDQFNLVGYFAACLNYDDYYTQLFAALINLGFMLGFTAEDIEEAYNNKMQVNHHRQDTGY
jgi:dimeric dUTPase (all-alpha-NTP-PPase superfamily)